jgi:prepilin-type N-terminal cleavage/methylation domain-containing protein
MNRLSKRQSSSGFTLIELIVVMVMVGALFSIAAPSWLAFMNRQRANDARDQIAQALRTAQTEARRTQRAHEFAFFIPSPNATPRLVVRPRGTTGTAGDELGNGSFQPGMVDIRLASNQVVVSDQPVVIFDKSGAISEEWIPRLPVTISVAAPEGANNKQCIVLQSLLGAQEKLSGSDCP